jgi:1-aminocyclopropane-1-carboxylate deaminase/D-cysteine desulfhydrase-like pyridoxal-dependent ACC family enzyme
LFHVPNLALRLPSPLTELQDERFNQHGVRLYLKRDDLIHPELRGNKWRKLRYNLDAAREQGFSRLLTFGGAFSNHISATAAAGHHFGFQTIGVIRGEEHSSLNDMLAFATSRDMELTYLDRDTYRRKTDQDVLDDLRERFGSFYLVPEGGSNALAVRGCAELPAEIDVNFDVICCAVGTGGTLAGIAGGLQPGQRAVGFSALKGGEFLVADVEQLQHDTFGHVTDNWSIETEFHFGGFAKRKPELNVFIADFEQRHGVLLDWVYVAKMLYGVLALIERGTFPVGTTIVAVITG